MIRSAAEINFATLSTTLERVEDKNVYLLVHSHLVFLYGLIDTDTATSPLLEKQVPWTKLVTVLNPLSKARAKTVKVLRNPFLDSKRALFNRC